MQKLVNEECRVNGSLRGDRGSGRMRGDRGNGRMRGERGSGSVRANANQVFCKMCCVLCFYGLLGSVLETSI